MMFHRPQALLHCVAACLSVQTLLGCEFKFDVTSQRTALENQVMGSYQELEDDLVLVSSERASTVVSPPLAAAHQRALDARLNQDFNRDDIDELKDLQLLGERNDGSLVTLFSNLAAASVKASAAQRKLAEALATEENKDRDEVWRRIITSNENLSAKDLPEVRRTYAKMQREQAAPGHWLQTDTGDWQRKDSSEQVRDQ